MRRLLIYTVFMIAVVIILPFLITKCGGTDITVENKIPKTTGTDEAVTILVYNSNTKKKMELRLEDYIKGVVAAEMPAAFESEALKAQAVAARTYAVGRLHKKYIPKNNIHVNEAVCTDPAHCQAWMDKNAAMAKWSIFTAKSNWKKIEDAVNATAGLVITYKGEIINPLYHSCSPGKTEDASELWDNKEIPYLKSVTSEGDEKCPTYKTLVNFETQEFVDIIKRNFSGFVRGEERLDKITKIDSYTKGDRVKNLKVGNIDISGAKARAIFGLASNCFTIEYPHDDEIRIVVTGSGHGAGMSQWGANGLAVEGGSYDEILKHYYTGVEIKNIKDINIR